MSKIIEYDIKDIEHIVSQLYSSMSDYSTYAFIGTLGAGKTTIIKSILARCGIVDQVTSPTFTYVNRYQNAAGEIFYHFDCYRLSQAQDFIDLGFYEYLYYPHSWSFIEWPEVITPLLPKDTRYVSLEHKGETKRAIHIYSNEKK